MIDFDCTIAREYYNCFQNTIIENKPKMLKKYKKIFIMYICMHNIIK